MDTSCSTVAGCSGVKLRGARRLHKRRGMGPVAEARRHWHMLRFVGFRDYLRRRRVFSGVGMRVASSSAPFNSPIVRMNRLDRS